MPDSDHKRPQRVAELLQHELASLITNELKDPRIGFVTVTEVRMSPDLRNARVYVSIYGTEEQRAVSLEGLTKAAGYLRRALGTKLELRYSPELSFVHDDSLDRADRLHALMQAIAHGESEAPPENNAPPVSVETDRSALAERRRAFDETKPEAPKRRKHRRRR